MLGFFVPWISSLIQYVIGLVDFYLTFVIDFLNYYVPGWKLVILSPFVITFIILPTLVVLYIYLSALLLYVYRRRHAIYEGFQENSLSKGYRKLIAVLWSGHGWIWHGYEVEGLENIPDGPAMIVYYHGAIPMDLYYLNSVLYLEKRRLLCSVMDNFAFKIPGLAKFFQFWGCFPGPRHRVVELLKAGELVAIAPGGVREALFSKNYSIVWGKRQGFAKAALEAKVPIVPVFTENIREAFDYIKTGQRYFRKLYEKTRWPLLPIYGGFPVKMTTHIGRPIYCYKDTTANDLVVKTRRQLENMIKRYQRRPGSITLSIIQRFKTKTMKELEILPLEGSNESSEGSVEGDQDRVVDVEHSNCHLTCKKSKLSETESMEYRTAPFSCQCHECKNAFGTMNPSDNIPSSSHHKHSEQQGEKYANRIDSNENCLKMQI